MFPNNRQTKPNTGGLFDQEDRGNPNAPSMRGNFVIGEEVLSYVMQCAQSGREVKLEIAAFQKVSRNTGKRYMSLQINTPYELRKGQQAGRRPGGNHPNYGSGPQRQVHNPPTYGQQNQFAGQKEMSYGQHRGGPPPVQSEDEYGAHNQEAPPWD